MGANSSPPSSNDLIQVILLAAERDDRAEPVNLATGHEISIRHRAERMAAQVGFVGGIVWDTSRPKGQLRGSR